MDSIAFLLVAAICSAIAAETFSSNLVILASSRLVNQTSFSMTFLITICTSFILEPILTITVSKGKDLFKLSVSIYNVTAGLFALYY